MLKIITGRISSGKTKYIIDAIGSRISNKQKSILIVPEHSTFNYEERICSQLNINGFIDVDVCSFNRFASKINDYCGSKKEAFLDDCTKAMLLRVCISKTRDSLSILKNSCMRKGFVQSLISLITNMQNCGYSAENLYCAASNIKDTVLRQKLTDIAIIYQEYVSVLSSGYTDNIDRIRCAGENVPYYSLNDAVIFIDGFDLFTKQLLSFIGALMHQTDVEIAVCSAQHKDDRQAYEFHEITLNKLIALAKAEGVEYEIISVAPEKSDKAEKIKFIEDNLYSYKLKVFDNAKCDNSQDGMSEANEITAVCYNSVYDELNDICQDISKKVRAGARYKDFCVLCCDVKNYSSAVRSVFKRYNIPVFADVSHDVTAHPVAVLLFSALRCCAFDFQQNDVVKYVSSHLTNISDDDADKFISFINTYNVKNYELASGFKRKIKNEERAAEFEQIRQQVISPVTDFHKELVLGQTAKEKAQACYTFLNNLGVYKKIEKLVDFYESENFFDLSDVTAQIWNISMQLLENIAEIMSNSVITIDEFRLTLLEGYTFSPAVTIPSTLDSVTFGDVSCAKELSWDYVYVIGASEGLLPRSVPDFGLLSARESDLLRTFDFDLANSIESEDARARFEAYSALSLPKKELHISVPKVALNGAVLNISPLISRLEAMHLATITFSDYNYVNNTFELPLTKEQVALAVALDNNKSEYSKCALNSLGDKQKVLSNAMRDKESNISEKIALELFGKKFSVSKIETFANCPLVHFINYGLHPIDEQKYSVDNIDIGNVIHQTLEDFTNKYIESNYSLTEVESKVLVSDLFNKNLSTTRNGVFSATSRQRVLNKILNEIVIRCALIIMDEFSSFKPLGAEISFGSSSRKNSHDSIKIQSDFGNVEIQGKIDRADVLKNDDGEFVRVVDYKTGKEAFSTSKIETGENLQLLIYMKALLDENASRKPAQAYLLHACQSDSQRSGVAADGFEDAEYKLKKDDIDYLITTAYTVAAEKINDMYRGSIIAHCNKNNRCAYCNYKSICTALNKTTITQKEDEEDVECELD